jgi:dihydrodipicolinate synthase/N-acetylneuraminate lyase
MQGVLRHAHMRPPLLPLGADDRQRLKRALEEAGEL